MLYVIIYVKEQYNEFKVATTQFQQPAICGHHSLHAPSPNLDYFEEIYWRVLHKGMTFNSSPDCQVETILWRRSTDGNRKTCYIVAQLLSRVWHFVNPWTAAHQASLFFTISWSLPKLVPLESVMPSHHLIPCLPLLLLPSIFHRIRIFSNESAFPIRWPKYWSFSFSISPSDEYSGWFPLGLTGLISLLSKGLSRVFSSATIQKHQFFGALLSLSLSQIYNNSKNNSNSNGKIVTAATCQWVFTVR